MERVGGVAVRRYAGKKDSDKNGFNSRKFYDSARWRRVRLVAMQRDHYQCQHCLHNDRMITIATEVHHIQELKDYPEKGLDLDNLVSLCWKCHEKTKQKKPEQTYRARVIKM